MSSLTDLYIKRYPQNAKELNYVARQNRVKKDEINVCLNCGFIVGVRSEYPAISCPNCGENICKNGLNPENIRIGIPDEPKLSAEKQLEEQCREIESDWRFELNCSYVTLSKTIVSAKDDQYITQSYHKDETCAIICDLDDKVFYEVCQNASQRPILYRTVMSMFGDTEAILSYRAKHNEDLIHAYVTNSHLDIKDLTGHRLCVLLVHPAQYTVELEPLFYGGLIAPMPFMRLCAMAIDKQIETAADHITRILIGHEYMKMILKIFDPRNLDAIRKIAKDLYFLKPEDRLYYDLLKKQVLIQKDKHASAQSAEEKRDYIVYETGKSVAATIGYSLFEAFMSLWTPELSLGRSVYPAPVIPSSISCHVTKAKPVTPPTKNEKGIILPQEIAGYLKKYIYKQERAQQMAATMLYNHMRGKRQNFLFAGPSGVGKTEIFRRLKDIDDHIAIVDFSSISSDGWSGSTKIHTMFSTLLERGLTPSEIEKYLFVLDEFDKFCTPRFASYGENVSLNLQGELLKIIEGTVLTVPYQKNIKTDDGEITQTVKKEIDTSKMSFAFCGNFEYIRLNKHEEAKTIGFDTGKREVTEKIDDIIFDDTELIKAGVMPEIAGRITGLVALESFDADDMEYLLMNGPDGTGIIAEVEQSYNVKLHLTDREIKDLATRASEKRQGVRYLRNQLITKANELIFINNG